MAWTDITNYVTFRSFLSTTLGGYIKDNFAWLKARNSQVILAVCAPEINWRDDADGSTTTYYVWTSGAVVGDNTNYVIHDRAQNANWTDFVGKLWVLVPAGTTTCRVHLRTQAEAVSSDLQLRANFEGDLYTGTVTGVAATAAWNTIDVTVTGVTTTAPVEFKIEIRNLNATTRYMKIYGIVVEAYS